MYERKGYVGVFPGTAITGFPPRAITNGMMHAADAVANQAQNDVTTTYSYSCGYISASYAWW